MQRDTSSVLAVSPLTADHETLRGMLECSPYRLHSARTCQEAWMTLHQQRIGAVITESSFPDGLCWKDLLDETAGMAEAPPLIVATRNAHERFQGEVLEAGGFDVLGKPFGRSGLLRLLSAAWRQAADWKILAQGAGGRTRTCRRTARVDRIGAQA